jgi:hypothetical protein
MENRVAFIIGNGTSRKDFNLENLRGAGTIFGCNALYRQFVPDYIVSIDEGIIKEIRESSFSKERFIVPPMEEQWEPAECNPYRPRSNAGINAMREAIKMGHNVLICFGFDFMLQDATQSVSNMYDGTKNYGPEVRANHADNIGRINYLNWLVKKHPEVEFFFVYPEDYRLTNASKSANIFFTTYKNLENNLHT